MKQISPGTRKTARNIRLLLLDVDGVLTDGAIVVDDRGVESKRFHVHDGQGITLLIRAGIQVGLINRALLQSSEPSRQAARNSDGLSKSSEQDRGL